MEQNNNPENKELNQQTDVDIPEGGTITEQVPVQKPKRLAIIILIVVFAIVLTGGAAYAFYYFFGYEEPTVPAGTEEVVEDEQNDTSTDLEYNLEDAVNWQDFSFSENTRELFEKNGFVVKPAYHSEFYSIYESNRYAQIPNFITTDSMLHNYHLVFDHLLENVEKEYLIPELKQLNANLLADSLQHYDLLKGTEWENAAKRNIAFFTVGSRLLDDEVSIPEIVNDVVIQELDLINKRAGIKESPVMNLGSDMGDMVDSPQGPLSLEALKEDYTQYIPRGHYDKSDELKAYFKSMMWYGRLTFRFKNDDEIRSATLISLALNRPENKLAWNKIYDPTNFFVGKSDDISFYETSKVINDIYGSLDLQKVTTQTDKFSHYVEALKRLDPPQINSIPIFEATIQPDREEEISGFRFMGQRFTIDASVFQRLVYREVLVNEEGEKRMLPKGLDIAAAFGSGEALNILSSLGETEYENYSENLDKIQTYISGLEEETWQQNLYWGWMYTLKALIDDSGQDEPDFMQTLAWVRKELNTFLGSWTELKHDTILYAKQVYAELGGGAGGDDLEKDDRGYVEPNVELYDRLATLLKQTMDKLDGFGLLSQADKDNLEKMRELSLKLKTISEKELAGNGLTQEEYDLIESYGGQLEHFWLEIYKEEIEESGMSKMHFMSENPAALVADVATDPNGVVLEEATGYVSEIYALVEVEGVPKIVKGGAYSYYEFPWPMNDRLTDKKWREMLRDGSAPALPQWVNVFTSVEE